MDIAKTLNKMGFDVMYLISSSNTTIKLCSKRTKLYWRYCDNRSHNPKEYNGYKVYDEDGCQFLIPEKSMVYLKKLINYPTF